MEEINALDIILRYAVRISRWKKHIEQLLRIALRLFRKLPCPSAAPLPSYRSNRRGYTYDNVDPGVSVATCGLDVRRGYVTSIIPLDDLERSWRRHGGVVACLER